MTQGYSGRSDVLDAKNVGTGIGVYKQKNDTQEIELHSLKAAASGDITVTDVGDEIELDVASATAATADTIVKRDGSGRIKAADGVANDDVATMSQLPAGFTVDEADFTDTYTATAGWESWDLSAAIPADARLAFIHGVDTASSGITLGARKSGSTASRTVDVTTGSGSDRAFAFFIVDVSASKTIEVFGPATGGTYTYQGSI